MAKVKWGVLGAGGIARRRTIPEGIVPASNAELVAVYSVSDGEAVARQFGAQNCDSKEALLASDIDAVYIATPTFLHREQVLLAAAAGRHVLCEKPLALNTDDATDMIRACDKAGVKLGVGLMMRYHASHVEAARLIRAGRIGTPVMGRAQLSCWYPPMENAWRQDPALGGGGALADLGVHCIDLLEMFFGRTRSVMASIGHAVHGYAAEDTAVVLLEFENGARGIVDCLFNVPDESSLNRLELYGSGGSILAEGTIGQGAAGTMTLRAAENASGYEAQQSRGMAGGVPIEPEPSNVYRSQIEAFSQAVIDGTEPVISGRDGLWNLRVLESCYESARTGCAIELKNK
ncbi:MAG: Gfo/Idh/MocA family oxidoreductase [Phycisphaerales bacterium]